ncbi:MAG: hypothetical protein SF123_16265 [Chloroflexota bacterium]|nr:hypothetical protein [Chloroflexota bacterium]
MRDFQTEIDSTEDISRLMTILAELNDTIEHLLGMSFEGDAAQKQAEALELILRYGEHKLDRLMD